MALSTEDIPTGPGPSGSMPFGSQTQTRQLTREMQSAGSSPRNPFPGLPSGGGQPPQAPQQPQQGQGQPDQGGAPVQPGPQGQQDPNEFHPDNVFSDFGGDGLSHMARLEVWANHPSRPEQIRNLVARYRGTSEQPAPGQ